MGFVLVCTGYSHCPLLYVHEKKRAEGGAEKGPAWLKDFWLSLCTFYGDVIGQLTYFLGTHDC